MRKPKLSIVIVNYNTRELLNGCLLSLIKVHEEVDFEIIVMDNGSTDGSIEEIKNLKLQIKNYKPKLKILRNRKNLGFAAGNNKAKSFCEGKYVLFLNSDTLLEKNSLRESVRYIDEHKSIGAMTCKIVLTDGNLDKDSRRSFITPWVGFVHLFLKLDLLFPKSRLFSKYWYGYEPEDKTHEVDAIQGAFFLTRRKILDKVGWFDEDYFLDGEDLDLCWKIREDGWKIVYYPKVKIVHLKGASKGKVESETKKNVPLNQRLKYRTAGVNSMEIFYRKHLWQKYPLIINITVIVGINIMKILRLIRTLILG